MSELFGQALRKMRLASGYTQRQLAEATGVQHTYLSKLECGKCSPPSTRLLHRIASALGADEENLLTQAGKPPMSVLMRENTELRRRLRDLWWLVASENCGCVSTLVTYKDMVPQIRELVGESEQGKERERGDKDDHRDRA